MALSTGLAAPLWTASQNQPDVTVNDSIETIDSSVAQQVVIDFPSDADYTLGVSGPFPVEWQHAVIEMTDIGTPLAAPRNVIVPTGFPRIYYFFNNTTGPGRVLTLKMAAGAGIAVGVGMRAIIQNDGTNLVRWTADI